MLSKSRSYLLAAALLAGSMTAALAQQNNPTGNMGSNRSSTAAPGTADSKAASGLNSGDVGSRTTGGNGAAMNSTTPGATGRTVVPGSNSSTAGAKAGTAEEKTGARGGTGGQ